MRILRMFIPIYLQPIHIVLPFVRWAIAGLTLSFIFVLKTYHISGFVIWKPKNTFNLQIRKNGGRLRPRRYGEPECRQIFLRKCPWCPYYTIVKDTVRNFTARPEIAVSWRGLTAGHPVSPCQVRETFRESRGGALSGGWSEYPCTGTKTCRQK